MRTQQRWMSGTLFVAALGVMLVARADTPAAKRPPAIAATVSAPLVAPMKLQVPAKTLPEIPLQDGLDRAYEQFREQTARAKRARDAYVTARNQCGARSFSVQDQREAGCLESDTVAQCNDKLESFCTRGPLRTYRRSNRILLRASENLKSAMSAYIEQVNQLPAED